MSNQSTPVADGHHSGVRWLIERPDGMAVPMAVVRLQAWHGPARAWVVEEHDVRAPNRATVVRLIDDMLERLRVKALSDSRRAAHLKVRVATSAVLPPDDSTDFATAPWLSAKLL